MEFYTFDVDDAKCYGVREAIVLHYLVERLWEQRKRAHIIGGFAMRELLGRFPFLTRKQIELALSHLCEYGAIYKRKHSHSVRYYLDKRLCDKYGIVYIDWDKIAQK